MFASLFRAEPPMRYKKSAALDVSKKYHFGRQLVSSKWEQLRAMEDACSDFLLNISINRDSASVVRPWEQTEASIWLLRSVVSDCMNVPNTFQWTCWTRNQIPAANRFWSKWKWLSGISALAFISSGFRLWNGAETVRGVPAKSGRSCRWEEANAGGNNFTNVDWFWLQLKVKLKMS